MSATPRRAAPPRAPWAGQAHAQASRHAPVALPPRLAPKPSLSLSLQFGDLGGLPDAALHRAALPRSCVQRWLAHALAWPGEFSVRIVGEAEGRALNRSYRGKDWATNVLTFDYAHAPVVMADLVLCAPVVAREAQAQAKPLRAHYAHLLVHGALHAQGWDHETHEADALAMEALEVLLLCSLGLANPY